MRRLRIEMKICLWKAFERAPVVINAIIKYEHRGFIFVQSVKVIIELVALLTLDKYNACVDANVGSCGPKPK